MRGCKNEILKPHGYSLKCRDHYEEEMAERKFTRRPNMMVIDNTKYFGTEMSENHYKELNTRVIDDNGNTLSGREGLKYMESKGNTYASRLNEYYK